MNGFWFLLKLTNDTPCEGYNLVLWVYYVDCWNLDQSYHILPPDPKTSFSNKLSITLPAVKHIAEGSILMSKANSFQLTLMYCELLKGFRLRFSQKMMTLELNWPQFMALPYCSAWHFSPPQFCYVNLNVWEIPVGPLYSLYFLQHSTLDVIPSTELVLNFTLGGCSSHFQSPFHFPLDHQAHFSSAKFFAHDTHLL